MKTLTEKIDSRILKLVALKELLAKLDIPPDFEADVNALDAELVLYARGIESVEKARHFLRERLGSWTDSIGMIWTSYGSALAEYKSPTWPIEIRLCVPIKEFPKEIMGDTCHFEERTSTDYAYVCDGNGARKVG